MAVLTQAQVTQYAAMAGFSGQALRTIVAIAQAESGFDTAAHNPGHPGDPEDSWGLWQININAHREVTISQATDPRFAAGYAYRLYVSSGGFKDWGTYTSGAYKKQPAWGNPSSASSSAGSIGAWSAQDLLAIWPWLSADLVKPAINNPYHSAFEASRGGVQDGVGIAVALDTPITSLTSGLVVAAGFGQSYAPAGQDWNYGGFIIVRSQIPDIGIADVFYRHMDTIDVKAGDKILVGQLLGLSGGQNKGGQNPESVKYSTGPHIDVGINPQTLPWRSIGPNVDPTAWLIGLVRSGPPARDQLHLIVNGALGGTAGATLGYIVQNGVTLSDQVVTGSGPTADSFVSIEQRMDLAMQFDPIDWSQISDGTHWWDYALPWQWQYAAKTDAANLAFGVAHNVTAFAFRALVVIIGVVLVVAVFAAIIKSIGEATGADEAIKDANQKAQQAATSAGVAA